MITLQELIDHCLYIRPNNTPEDIKMLNLDLEAFKVNPAGGYNVADRVGIAIIPKDTVSINEYDDIKGELIDAESKIESLEGQLEDFVSELITANKDISEKNEEIHELRTKNAKDKVLVANVIDEFKRIRSLWTDLKFAINKLDRESK